MLDGRKPDRKTLAESRLMAMERLCDGAAARGRLVWAVPDDDLQGEAPGEGWRRDPRRFCREQPAAKLAKPGKRQTILAASAVNAKVVTE